MTWWYPARPDDANLVNVITLAVFVALVLATARLTRAVSIDDITAPIRAKIDRRFGNTSQISKLVWCYWCSGWWVASAATAWTLVSVAALGHITWATAAVAWPIVFPAVAYSASWILDKEVNDGVPPQ